MSLLSKRPYGWTSSRHEVEGVKVSAKVLEEKVAGDKIRVIRYHSKKRVHKETGHRQKYSLIEITSIK